jgi:beta-glucosidase
MPDGDGAANPEGLDFYDRLVDSMLEHGIEPYATLFHWDLPSVLQERGGWTNRETVAAFVRYADTVSRRLGDRVKHWMTHNEPWVVAFVGHLYGAHAPGAKDLAVALQTAHGILLSHGLAVPALRANGGIDTQVGIVHNLEWVEPASPAEEDVAAARRHDGAFNRWYLDPIFRGEYPRDMRDWYGATAPVVEPDDLRQIAVPIDFLGINYYTRRIVAHDDDGSFLSTRHIRYPFVPHADYEEWEVNPEALYRLLMRVHREYGAPTLYVTENGTPLSDTVDHDGFVRDRFRIDYLRGHFAAVWEAIQGGADIRGYFVWSFMDNFEWNLGYTKRFGLVHVDYETQKRTIKDSGRWYSEVIRTNRVWGR